MPEIQELFRLATQDVQPDPGYVERQHGHRRKRERKRKLGAAVAVVAIGAVAAVGAHSLSGESERRPLGVAPSVPADITPSASVPPPARGSYLYDLNTGVATPLARSIRGSQFAASPDGSMVAYTGTGDEGTPQVFVADIDGAGVRQVTHDPVGASQPAWSPDGASLAYVGYGIGVSSNLFVLDIANGKEKQITDGGNGKWGPSFTPDGSSLVYTDPGTGSDWVAAEMRTVRIAGGPPSSALFGGGVEGIGSAGGGSLSPDGSLATMTGNEVNGPGAVLFVSNVDGSDRRVYGAYGTDPAGTWSPDGTRIVALAHNEHDIIVIDVATGKRSRVAQGRAASWLDDHTLLVEA